MALTTGGLNFIYPDENEDPWFTKMAAAFAAISAHDHTGGGKGNQIQTGGIADSAVTAAKILLANNTFLKGLNGVGVALDLIGVDTNNRTVLPKANAKAYSYPSSTISAVAPMTVTGTPGFDAFQVFEVTGELVTCYVDSQALTLATTQGPYVTFTLPFPSKNLGVDQYCGVPLVSDSGSDKTGGHFIVVNNSSTCRVAKRDFANWVLGTAAFAGTFSYLRA